MPGDRNDHSRWGTETNLLEFGAVTVGTPYNRPLAFYTLDRHRDANTEWTVYAKHVVAGGNDEQRPRLLIETGSGDRVISYAQQPVTRRGLCMHVVAENMRVSVVGESRAAVGMTEDRVLGWIARGRPTTYVLNTEVRYVATPAVIGDLVVPEWAVRVRARGYLPNAGLTPGARTDVTLILLDDTGGGRVMTQLVPASALDGVVCPIPRAAIAVTMDTTVAPTPGTKIELEWECIA